MQNNQSFLQKKTLFDFDLAEDYRNTKEVDFLEDLNDNDDDSEQNYAEINNQTQSLENSDLKASQPDVNLNIDDDIINRGDGLLSTTINDADYDIEEDFSEVEENEIHYLNFIRKSKIAVSQQNAVKSSRYNKAKEEENIKTYTIVCIDDSKAVVNAIKMYLDDNLFSVVGINDPLKALMQIVRLKPDVILLDITMPTLDGYELCSLLRKHSSLKKTPVIMVTGKKGIINRVKAKMVKASDYLTKPFHKKDLLKIIFKYIV